MPDFAPFLFVHSKLPRTLVAIISTKLPLFFFPHSKSCHYWGQINATMRTYLATPPLPPILLSYGITVGYTKAHYVQFSPSVHLVERFICLWHKPLLWLWPTHCDRDHENSKPICLRTALCLMMKHHRTKSGCKKVPRFRAHRRDEHSSKCFNLRCHRNLELSNPSLSQDTLMMVYHYHQTNSSAKG